MWNMYLFQLNESLSLSGWKKFSVVNLLSSGWLVSLRNGFILGAHYFIMVTTVVLPTILCLSSCGSLRFSNSLLSVPRNRKHGDFSGQGTVS